MAALRDWRRFAIPSAVAALTFVAFLPVLTAQFVTWDDDSNFLGNPHYRGLGPTQLRWMWSTFHMGHYVPLSWMTLGLDYELWGMHPAGYHLVNLLLHVANAVLLYQLARRLLASAFGEGQSEQALKMASAFAALLFAIHPLRVESVAWITERRDVLSLMFYLASVLLYLRAVEPNARSWLRSYGLALLLYACALLSKATSVTLPAVLLLLSVYPLRRLGGTAGWRGTSARRVYLEILPFAVLALATSALSIVALHPLQQLGMGGKIAVSAYSLRFYLQKTIAPFSLAPLYEMPKEVHPGEAMFVVSYMVVAALTLLAVALRRRHPGVLAAWTIFLVIVLPMLGVVQNGPQIAADRYTYHAAPALALLAGAAVLLLPRPLAPLPVAIGAALLLAFGALTWRQTLVWRDSEHLWSRVLKVDEGSSVAHTALANVLFDQNRLDEAMTHYARSIELDPNSQEVDNNWGVSLMRQGRLDEAIVHYKRALDLKPTHYEAHNNWGAALAQQGELDAAIGHYRAALAIRPDFADAHVNWGNALVRQKRLDEAIAHYDDALRLRPERADAHLNWGVALAQQGRLDDAIVHFQQALVIDPTSSDARTYLERAQRLRNAQP